MHKTRTLAHTHTKQYLQVLFIAQQSQSTQSHYKLDYKHCVTRSVNHPVAPCKVTHYILGAKLYICAAERMGGLEVVRRIHIQCCARARIYNTTNASR